MKNLLNRYSNTQLQAGGIIAMVALPLMTALLSYNFGILAGIAVIFVAIITLASFGIAAVPPTIATFAILLANCSGILTSFFVSSQKLVGLNIIPIVFTLIAICLWLWYLKTAKTPEIQQ